MATILAVDTSAKSVSCALVRDGSVLASYFANNGLTHSQTLLPMLDSLLQVADVSIDQIDALAVNAGPGSFTGVRIGVSAVKGIAFTEFKPCVSVSTLESIAENMAILPGTYVCGVMDARCQQVYTALFAVDENGTPVRVSEDTAVSITELGEQLKTMESTVVLVGDGSELCYRMLKDTIPHLVLAPPAFRFQNAVSTCFRGRKKVVPPFFEGTTRIIIIISWEL